MKNTIVIVSPRFLQRPQKAKSREPAYSQVLNQKSRTTVGTVGRDGALVKSQPEGRGFDSRSSRHVGTSGKSFTDSCLPMRLGVKLRYCIRAVVGSASE